MSDRDSAANAANGRTVCWTLGLHHAVSWSCRESPKTQRLLEQQLVGGHCNTPNKPCREDVCTRLTH